MSLILKSDNLANNFLGTLETLNTSSDEVFNTYKERVLDDGGIIKDEERTKRAFSTLFNLGLYGNLAFFVAGFAGVKIASNNTVQKAYSLDGEDLVGFTQGGGRLPTVNGDFFDFSTNTPAIINVGGCLTLENYPRMAKDRDFITFFMAPSSGENSEVSSVLLSAVASDGYTNDTVAIPLVDISDYRGNIQNRILGYGGNAGRFYTTGWFDHGYNRIFAFHSHAEKGKSLTSYYRSGTLVQQSTENVFERFLQRPVDFHIGRAVFKSGTSYGNTPITLAGALINGRQKQAEELSKAIF